MVSVAKLVDAADCGSAERNLMRVQVSSFTLKCLYSITASMSALQAEDVSSILARRTYGRMMQLVDILASKTRFCEFKSRFAYFI